MIPLIKKYYYDFGADQLFYSDIAPRTETSVEITLTRRNELLAGMNNSQQLIYMDADNAPQLRDQFTKSEDGGITWIPDTDAIAANAHTILVNQATIKFNQYVEYSYGYRFSKLTTDQQIGLTPYLDALSAIIDGSDLVSTELPTAPF